MRYLDHADRRIRRYVTAKRKLIALLEEEKQAVVNRAVTRGLDPNVRLKPSGVEWLGEVPEHWEVVPVKRASSSHRDYGRSNDQRIWHRGVDVGIRTSQDVTPRKKSKSPWFLTTEVSISVATNLLSGQG